MTHCWLWKLSLQMWWVFKLENMSILLSGGYPWGDLRVRQGKLVPCDLYTFKPTMCKYFQEWCQLKKQIFYLIFQCLQYSSVLTIHIRLLMLSAKCSHCVCVTVATALALMKASTWTQLMSPPLPQLDLIHIFLISIFFEPSLILVWFPCCPSPPI